MGQVLPRALTGLVLKDEKGERVYCEGLTVRPLPLYRVVGPQVIAPQYTAQFSLALAIFTVYAPTILPTILCRVPRTAPRW